MQASELRIGNFIQTDKSIAMHAITISRLGDIKIRLISGDKDPVVYVAMFGNFRIAVQLSECQPITLTDEWLGRFGFGKVDLHFHKKYQDDQVFCISGGKNNIWQFFVESEAPYSENSIDIEIKYVHQLQNLYFALTNSELIFKF